MPFKSSKGYFWQSGKTGLGVSCVTTITDEMHPDLSLRLRCVSA